MATFNILRNASIRNSMTCRHDSNEGYAVVWDEDENFKQYTEFSGLTTRLVWDRNYFAVATSGVAFIGPNTDQPPFDGGVYDQIKAEFRIEVGFGQQAPTTGRIQFQTSDDPVYDEEKSFDFPVNPDNAYNLYTIDMSPVKDWQGDITRIRIYPFIDGDPGNIVHFKSLRVQSTSNFACDTKFNGPLCSHFSQFVHPCPWTGAGGSSTGVTVGDGIDILPGVNDRLIVNVNDYGDQAVTLTPVSGAKLEDIASDLEDKLANVGIGGYAGNKVVADLGRLRIVADDTREASSTVVVKDTPAARTLGFYDSSGNKIADEQSGVEAATRFEPAGTRQLSKGEIAHLYSPDPGVNKGSILLDPRRFSVQAGRPDFSDVQREQKISFNGDTIIDFNNPITNNGIITFLTYTGDAASTTKFAFFRPKADGSLVQYKSVPLGQTTGPFNDKVFEVATEVRVRKGDLIGIYNGRLDAGRAEQRPNASYFIYDGELNDGDTIPSPQVRGRGEAGLRLFARGQDRETEVVLDIEFEQPELIEEVTAFAIEEEREEEIKLSRARAGGVGGGPFVEGETGLDKFGAQAPPLVNLGAATDGVALTTPNAPTLHPSWLDSSFSPADKFDQTTFSVILDFAKGIPVFFDINRVKMYFRDVNNIKYFSIEYPVTTNEEDTIRNWGAVSSKYNLIELEGQPLIPTTHPLYENPIHPTAEGFENSYQFLEYRNIDFRFDPVRARSIRYNVKNFFFEDDPNKRTLSDFTLAPSPHILEMEVYARSIPRANVSDNFFFESSNDGLNFVLHSTVRDEGETSARYLIGYPVQYLRLHITPQSQLEVKNLSVSLSQSTTELKTNAGDSVVSLGFSKEDFSSFETFQVTNVDQESFNYFVDISGQKNPVERCILWNRMGSEEQLFESELGPSPVISKRDPFFPREYNYAYLSPSYVADPFWLFNGKATSYISYDHGATWEPRGNTVTDYNRSTSLNAVSSVSDDFLFVYVLIDLGDVYNLDTVQTISPSGHIAFSGPLYTSKNVSDPNQLNIVDDFVGVKSQARWLRYRAFSRSPGDPEIAGIAFLRASLNVTSLRNKGKISWLPVPRLTNYVFGSSFLNPCGEGWQCEESGFRNYYAIDLQDHYRITNIITGPNFSDALALTDNIDSISPGGPGSRFSSSSTTNGNITYSSAEFDDPNKVIWGSFGEAPGDKSRWILIRSLGGIVDEVAVHIESNVAKSKPSFGSERWWTAQLGEVRKDKANFMEGSHSIAVDYSSGLGPAEEEIEIQQSFGIDHILAKRDQLRLLIYVSDASQIDFSRGHIALGRNTTEDNGGNAPLQGVEPDRVNYYQWNLSELESLITTGWNEIFLPFTDNFRVGEPYFTRDNFLALSSISTSGRSRIRWFRLRFAGVENNTSFTINLDGLEIVRGDFLPAKYGNGLYLAGREYARFPMTNFDTLRGTVEFYINADWTKSPGCNTCDDPRDHTIFRFFNSDGYVMAAYMTGEGLRVYFTDDIKHYFLDDNNSPLSILVGQNTHFAVTWDLLGQDLEDAVRVYIDGKLSSSFKVSDVLSDGFTPNPNVMLVLGGIGWDGVIIPLADSVGGVIDNLRVYNYPKTDFTNSIENEGLEHIRPPDDLVEISVDGTNFYGREARGDELPLLVRNVGPGDSFNVYVRNKSVPGQVARDRQGRTSFLEILKARAG